MYEVIYTLNPNGIRKGIEITLQAFIPDVTWKWPSLQGSFQVEPWDDTQWKIDLLIYIVKGLILSSIFLKYQTKPLPSLITLYKTRENQPYPVISKEIQDSGNKRDFYYNPGSIFDWDDIDDSLYALDT